VVVSAIATYDGTCSGGMDIPPYPCSLRDSIGRNTISPFALVPGCPHHGDAFGGGFALGVLLLGVLCTHGMPDRMRIDRNPCFVGGNAKADFPLSQFQVGACSLMG